MELVSQINWDILDLKNLVSWGFGLLVFTAIWITFHQYAQYKIGRGRKRDRLKHPKQGSYFNRFVPLDKKAEFDEKIKLFEADRVPKKRRRERYISLAFALCYVSLLVGMITKNSYRLFRPMGLTSTEMKALTLNRKTWLTGSSKVSLSEKAMSAIPLSKNFIFIGDNVPTQSVEQKISIQASEIARNIWIQLLEKMGAAHKQCSWQRIVSCQISSKNSVLLLLPSRWETTKIESWLKQGYPILAIGAPDQVRHSEWAGQFKFRDLRFKRLDKAHSHDSIIFKGERPLTLGLDPGLKWKTPPLANDYILEAPAAQATNANSNSFLKSQFGVRLLSRIYEKSRFVWLDLDFSSFNKVPEQKALARLFRNIYFFLAKKSHHSFGTWPAGKKMAVIIEQDTENHFSNSKNLIKIFSKGRMPITWFMLSDEAEMKKGLTRKLAAVGEVACHGDNHAVFPDGSLYRQVARLAKCKKVLQLITGQKIRGFRPPEEKYNIETLNALGNNNFEYFFAEAGGDRYVPRIFFNREDKGEVLVSLNRSVVDDYHLWGKNSFSVEESLQIIEEDYRRIESFGGLYAFSFHSQYMGDDAKISVVESLVKLVKASNSYAATTYDLVKWWRFRDQLIRYGVKSIDKDLLEKYKPVKIILKEDGRIAREVI